MVRSFLLLAAFLVGTTNLVAQQTSDVTIRFHGHSFFEIESSKGTKIVCDPHQIEAYGRQAVTADLVLFSHSHNDHTQLEPIQNRMKAKVIPGFRGQGRQLDWNFVDEAFRDVHVRSVGVYHDDVKGMEKGKNTVFILEVDGLKIVHLGDLGHVLTEQDRRRIGPVDVLMIPVGGVYTLNGSEAKKVVEQLKPKKYILPMHYGTNVFPDLLTPAEFLDEQKNVKKLPGNKLTIEKGFDPMEPVIVLMGWK